MPVGEVVASFAMRRGGCACPGAGRYVNTGRPRSASCRLRTSETCATAMPDEMERKRKRKREDLRTTAHRTMGTTWAQLLSRKQLCCHWLVYGCAAWVVSRS